MVSEAVMSGLKKQLEVKEEVLKIINEKQTQLQTDIVGLTKTVQSLNQTIKWLCGTLEQLQTTIDGVKKTVESLKQMPQLLCELPKDGSTYEITAVTVSSLKYLRKSSSSNLRQISTFRRTVLQPSSGSHLYNGLAPHVYIYRVVLAICTG
jgi:predicted RNase H-like nuclease (RuvC/YqgF family)